MSSIKNKPKNLAVDDMSGQTISQGWRHSTVWNELTHYVGGICSQITCDVADRYIASSGVLRNVHSTCDLVQKRDTTTVASQKVNDGLMQETEIGEKLPNEDDKGSFTGIGITADTLNLLSESNLPPSGMFCAGLPSDVEVILPET